MPKIKTHSGAKKRFHLTASGKVKHKKAFARHKLGEKSPKRGRHLRKAGMIVEREAKIIKQLIPYA